MSDTLVMVVFCFFAVLVVGSATVVVFARNLVHSAFALFFTLFGMAGLYAMLGADFLAAAQVMVYVGGIMVLLLFGIMLTHWVYGLDLRTGTYQLIPGLIAYVVVAGVILYLLLGTGWQMGIDPGYEPTTEGLGKLFLTRFLLPFEVASVLLLAALIGAVMLVRGRPGEKAEDAGPGDESTGETGGATP